MVRDESMNHRIVLTLDKRVKASHRIVGSFTCATNGSNIYISYGSTRANTSNSGLQEQNNQNTVEAVSPTLSGPSGGNSLLCFVWALLF